MIRFDLVSSVLFGLSFFVVAHYQDKPTQSVLTPVVVAVTSSLTFIEHHE